MQTIENDFKKVIFDSIPDGLKKYDQWVLSCKKGVPFYENDTGSLVNASPVSGPWYSFKKVVELAKRHDMHIGFVLTTNDPYTCIDIDIKDKDSVKEDGGDYSVETWTTEQQLNVYKKIQSGFDSYTEVSASKKGIHIWVKGDIGAGKRRNGVEVYSQERVIRCTGYEINEIDYKIDSNHRIKAVVKFDKARDIIEHQALLSELYREMSPVVEIDLIEKEETISDDDLLAKATSAENSDKFNKLCAGQYSHYKKDNGELLYPSQSEADVALMSILAFYSESNEQCRRLFRMSALGRREKANIDDRYLNLTLKTIRSRQAAADGVLKVEQAASEKLIKSVSKVVENEEREEPFVSITWPPGLVGEIARFVYKSAPRPVKEVAIVAALGLVAGIVGKSFHISQSGLNLYVILVAQSSVGKEAMHTGIALLLQKIKNSIPSCEDFVDFNDFASGPALTKKCANTNSFVNVAGEWGRKLKRLSCEDGRDGPMAQLRTVMTSLYQKSGPNSIVGGLSYSKKEENVGSINGVAYSMIGETTPGTFYDSLTDSMMEDGFLSRFTVIEYKGKRPKRNVNLDKEPDEELIEKLCSLMTQSMNILNRYDSIRLEYESEALNVLDAFDDECDDQINSSDDESWRQMWSRSHLKAIRISGVLAVADNHVLPVIKKQHVEWALLIVRRNINMMIARMRSGDVGNGDMSREKKLLSIISEYLKNKIKKGYNIPDSLRTSGIVPRKYLMSRATRVSTFNTYKMGTSIALNNTLKALIDNGYISEVNKEDVVMLHGNQGKCYRVLSLPEF